MIQENHINHIVIADDDNDDVVLFRDAVKQLTTSLKISMVENGEKLLRFLELNIPDLIFLDLNMPIMNGHECLQAIRSDERLESVPVIIYSTSSNPVSIEQCYTHGANIYMIKPYAFTSITKMLEEIFSMDWKNTPAPARDKFLLKS